MNHSFNVALATKVGPVAAIIFNNIGHWVQENEIKQRNYHDGCHWVYNTVKQWSEFYPYLTKRQVEGGLSKLRDAGYVVAADYNTDGRVRTLWYTLTPLGREVFFGEIHDGSRLCINESAEMQKRLSVNESIYNRSITYGNTDNEYTCDKPEQKRNQGDISQGQLELDDARKEPKKRGRKPFVPPTPDEVREFAVSSGYGEIDAEYFCDYYSANDWHRADGRKMVNWKQAVITWKRNEQRRKSDNPTNGHDYSEYAGSMEVIQL